MSELPERLPSRPLRNWFLAWHIHTGDPADVIARGFDLEPALVEDLLRNEVPLALRTDDCVSICQHIRVAPAQLWPLSRSRALGDRSDFEDVRSDLPESLLSVLPR